jgi:hypothetical protein
MGNGKSRGYVKTAESTPLSSQLESGLVAVALNRYPVVIIYK